jgi:hypothetical protein
MELPWSGDARRAEPSRQNGAVPSIQNKGVPTPTHAVLRQRAAARPTIDEVLARAGGRTGGSVPVETAVEIVRADRGVSTRGCRLLGVPVDVGADLPRDPVTATAPGDAAPS